MKELACSEERFNKDTATHEMSVILNQGLHRHLRFARPGCSAYHFNITTWPGYLCISGDMGCYVFSRLNDMFEFFRGRGLNPGYWEEKVQAGRDKVKEFSAELFIEGFLDSVGDYLECMDLTFGQKQTLVDLARNELVCIEQTMHHYCDTVYNLNFHELDLPEGLDEVDFPNFQVDEFWSMETYTFHYIWCLRAIVWAIKQFDEKIIEGGEK